MPVPPPALPRRQMLALAAWPALGHAQGRPPLRVGAGGDVATMSQAMRQVQDGDTLHILPGEHPGDVVVIPPLRLRILGLGGQPPLFSAQGRHAEGKAIWVLRGGDVHIEHVAFSGCRVPSGNGAGIRAERGRLQLRDCQFTDNQMGLLSGNDPQAELHIERCSFSDAPDNHPVGLPHLLYVGAIGRFTLLHSTLQRGRLGHLLKCRARSALISHNQLDDGPDGSASYEIDLPNGGEAQVLHNTIGQSARTENPVLLSYGAELDKQPPWPVNRLLVAHNRFLNRLGPAGVVVRAWAERLPPAAEVDCHDNQLLGGGALQLGPQGRSRDNAVGPLPA